MRAQDLPSFKDMPTVQGMPQGTSWGLWDKDGKRDSCGTLNLLTPENTLEARKEIKHGISVALNWDLECVHEPGFGREKPQHTIKNLKSMGFIAHDDIIHINTQSGSQWDGFRHWGHQDTGLYYNNLAHDDITNPEHSDKNGIDHWTKRGGIVGRAVLIDYAAYCARRSIDYSVTTRHEITLEDIKTIAAEQGVEFRPADILIVRSGFVKWYNGAGEEERRKGVKNGHEFVGVRGDKEMVEWLWDNHFSAVAGDAIAWEAWPPKAPYRLHDHLLAMFGCPIGELWNLEELSKACEEKKQYTFFMSSGPLNVHGGIGSPPNAVAIL
ncbi:cyclase protein [Rutstroemia sp. NJR-2017a BBW]|nr:cyclase protein [Rutstroemia sp. NJR-2017a BBW]